MTPAELNREWSHRFDERIGILSQGQSPTREQVLLAIQDADNHRKQLRLNQPPDPDPADSFH